MRKEIGRVTNFDNYRTIEGLSNYKFFKNSTIWPNVNNRFLKPHFNKRSGYYYIFLVLNDGKIINFRLHRILAYALLENPNNYKIVNHIDGNRVNNNIDNLEWCTSRYNNDDGLRRRLANYQSSNSAKLDYAKVLSIKTWEISNKKTSELSSVFNVSNACIGGVVAGKTWKHITNNLN